MSDLISFEDLTTTQLAVAGIVAWYVAFGRWMGWYFAGSDYTAFGRKSNSEDPGLVFRWLASPVVIIVGAVAVVVIVVWILFYVCCGAMVPGPWSMLKQENK